MNSRPRTPRLSVVAGLAALALVLAALLGGAVGARAEGTIAYTKEGPSQYESQLAGGQIQSVLVNKRLRTLRVTLKNGEHVLVKYGPKEGPRYYAAITAHHIPLSFLATAEAKKEQSSKPVHHKLRYIAGGLLVVVIVIVAAVLIYRRRQEAALD